MRSHVYIVDDDPSFGRSLKRMLNVRGITADYYESADSFLAGVPHDRHNGTVVVDLHMPKCDGFAMMKKMRDAGYQMPVVVITGQAGTDSRSKALQHGAVGFLEKPFSEQSLLDLIQSEPQGCA
jgi:two-component system response regulator FixJ